MAEGSVITISIHAPHAGRDLAAILPTTLTVAFQSTRPMRGATHDAGRGKDPVPISIHAPHAGRDVMIVSVAPAGIRFQSTRPMRGATENIDSMTKAELISIHAPHAGRDETWWTRP